MLDWNDLRYFLAVARNGSTIAAAKSLHVSQSTMHRRLEELEARLGRHLVVRQPTGYKLTEFGVHLVPLAERVEADVESLERFVTAADTGLTGPIRLTCSETVAFRLIKARLLEEFRLRCPGIEIELLMSDRFFDLAKGEADVAIRAGSPDDESLIGRKLADVGWALYASSDYLRRQGRLNKIEDIGDHFVIEMDGGIANTDTGRWMSAACANAKLAGRSNSLSGMLMSVKSGAGIGALPMPLGSSDVDLELLLKIPKVTTGIYLLAHPDLRQMPRINALFEFINTERESIRRALVGEV